MTTIRSLLGPAYELGDGSADGAQLVDGQWWHPVFGCDSLQYVVDNARQALAPEVAIPAEQWHKAAQQIQQHANDAGLSPKDWADKFNKFNPKLHTQQGPMTFDPTSIKPPVELMAERMNSQQTHHYEDYTFFACWGAAQAVEALRHQWPEPITDRPPTEEDGDCDGYVQLLYAGKWSIAAWHVVADTYSDWLHTPSWRPKPEPTLKQQALEIVKHVFPCTPEQAETLLAALALIPDAPDAPDTTP